eukprot:GFYU01004181.1.p1 GENE.GFYU01004181.1~~GFYU01004181.1.p1  ORF type:complete len:470 (+),score=142.96 GFYU01004181.1:122-1411(+)
MSDRSEEFNKEPQLKEFMDTDSDEESEVKVGEEVDISPQRDGGIVKKILSLGKGWMRPAEGSEVHVHYVGTLEDGSEFDSSRKRGQPLKFTLGRGQVIKAWDVGVKTMKKGEKAVLTCKPDYAYGASGHPPTIPANATLIFEVELVKFMNEEDINNDGSVLKTTISEGADWQKPTEGSEVTVSWKAVYDDDDSVFEEVSDVKIVIDEAHALVGLEEAIRTMKKGEVSKFNFFTDEKRLAEDPDDCLVNVPSRVPVTYTVTLTDFTNKKGVWELSPAEKIAEAEDLKNGGNQLFKRGKHSRALAKYKKAAECLEADYAFSDEEKASGKAALVPIHSNTAFCHLKMGDFKETIKACDKALTIDADNTKVLFRKAKALSGQGDWQDAIDVLEKALAGDGNNADVVRELQLARKRLKEENQKTKAMYTKMFTS